MVMPSLRKVKKTPSYSQPFPTALAFRNTLPYNSAASIRFPFLALSTLDTGKKYGAP
jgi:hypothetical protein